MREHGEAARQKVMMPLPDIRPGLYRHFKGKSYRLLSIARHSESLEPMVVYEALYGEHGIWVRPASMWNETVEHEGKMVPRFEYAGTE